MKTLGKSSDAARELAAFINKRHPNANAEYETFWPYRVTAAISVREILQCMEDCYGQLRPVAPN